MPQWERVCAAQELPLGSQRFVSLAGRELALFHLADPPRLMAVNNGCPHAGGNLSAGTVCGSVVACPWHQWEFDLATGRCVHNEAVQLRRHAVAVRDGGVWVDLEPMMT